MLAGMVDCSLPSIRPSPGSNVANDDVFRQQDGFSHTMTLTAKEFWGDNLYNSPEWTDEMVSVAEATLGVKLPSDYVELLRY